jgi:phosphotransferase system enzyme I (PtsI)
MVDFFSVGTNDLTQYTLAADRQNPKVAGLLEENLDPVFDLIEKCAKEIHKNGGWIGVCGELGADLSYTERFVNMKIDELSVSPPYILGIKKKICSLE